MSSLRKCRVCGLEAHTPDELIKFTPNKRSKHGRDKQCLQCAYAKRDPEERKRNRTEKYKETKKKAVALFENKCGHCGLQYDGTNSVVFDFHHLDPNVKDKNPGLFFEHRWERCKEELDKCMMLCANCHRLEHERMRNVER